MRQSAKKRPPVMAFVIWFFRITFGLVAVYLAYMGHWQVSLLLFITMIGTGANQIVGGGGVIIIPYAFAIGIALPIAIALTRFASCFAACISAWRQRGRINTWRQWVRGLIVCGVCLLGGYYGASLVDVIDPKDVTRAATCLLVIAIAFIALRSPRGKDIDRPETDFIFSWWWLLGVIFLIAGYGGAIGGGVATMLTSVLTLMLPGVSVGRVLAVRLFGSLAFNLGAVWGYRKLIFGNLRAFVETLAALYADPSGTVNAGAVTAWDALYVFIANPSAEPLIHATTFLAVMMFFAAGVGSGLANDVIDKFPGTLRLIISIGASALVALMVYQNWADYMENSAWLVLLVFITITMTVVVCIVKLKRRPRMVPASA